MNLDIKQLSAKYDVRRLAQVDVPEVFALCEKNPLYYEYCPPFVTEQSIIDDMNALPPGKTKDRKSSGRTLLA